MSVDANLYLDQIDLARYLGPSTCQVCHVDSLQQLIDRLRSGQFCPGQCPHWPRERIEAFRTAVDAGELLPRIPSLTVPRPAEIGRFDFNEPAADAPLLVTGNSRLTHEVLLAVISTTSAPLRMISVDTRGHTVDMSLVYGTLTPESVTEVIQASATDLGALTGRIILPGLARSLKAAVSKSLGLAVEVGPVCAAELPLFFGSYWTT